MYMLRFGLAFGLLAAALPGADAPSASGVDLKAMDPSVNPCQNFYQYACGGWRKNNPVPADQSRWARFNELAERNLAIERGILEKAGNSQIGEFYAACMDEPAIEKKGVEPIEPLLKQIDAGCGGSIGGR
jgi:endothelin-converting enzyme/putative endopeptidase